MLDRTMKLARAAGITAALGFAFSGTLPAQETSVVGDWEGTIAAQMDIPIVIHITETGDGGLAATMDSPNQGAMGIPTTDVMFSEGTLTFSVPDVPGGGAYEGTLGEDGTIDGTWSQGPQSIELDLTRVESDGG